MPSRGTRTAKPFCLFTGRLSFRSKLRGYFGFGLRASSVLPIPSASRALVPTSSISSRYSISVIAVGRRSSKHARWGSLRFGKAWSQHNYLITMSPALQHNPIHFRTFKACRETSRSRLLDERYCKYGRSAQRRLSSTIRTSCHCPHHTA